MATTMSPLGRIQEGGIVRSADRGACALWPDRGSGDGARTRYPYPSPARTRHRAVTRKVIIAFSLLFHWDLRTAWWLVLPCPTNCKDNEERNRRPSH